MVLKVANATARLRNNSRIRRITYFTHYFLSLFYSILSCYEVEFYWSFTGGFYWKFSHLRILGLYLTS